MGGWALRPVSGYVQANGLEVDGYLRPSGSVAETMDRRFVTGAVSPLASGTLFCGALQLAAGSLVSSITFASGTTALATGTHQWFALLDASLNLLAVTTDDLATAWAAGATKTLNIASIASGAASSYRVQASGVYYLGVMVAATTVPNLQGVNRGTVLPGLAPILGGSSTAALTAPPAFPFTGAALNASSGLIPYAHVS